ncbi:MAG: CMP-N-acetylneuraminic acid synthetase NeuA2 [uncultured bacterium]|nr:MAG: CMP-N-acetylneuraminic acid synthetase NeuA2 [uncultured bacterium]
MKTLAIITARGGSKRILKKNIKEFCGKPIIAYSIEAALESSCFSEVMVSTDDNEIKEVSLKYGAKVPFMRSEVTSDDFAGTEDVVLEVINNYEKAGNKFEYACCIYPTAPFIMAEKLIKSFEILKRDKTDSVIPIVKFDFPVQRALKIVSNRLEYATPEYAEMRSQDLEPMYHDCGQFYWIKVDSFLNQKNLFMKNTKGFEIPENEARDIDTEEDWKIAEVLYACLKKENEIYEF